jgi:hypothetical protein
MKLRFADPKVAAQRASDSEVRKENHTKEEIIELAMEAFQWKEAKCLSWYKLQIPQLGGNSPLELVQRQQTSRIIDFLGKARSNREKQDARVEKPILKQRF